MMSSQTKTIMGVINIVGGEWAAEAPNVLAVREPASFQPGAGKGDLFVLVELRGDPASPASQRLCRSWAETVRNVYYQSQGGVIAGLRRALAAVAGAAPPTAEAEGMLASLGVVVVRDGDAFVAGVGPTVAYVVARGRARRFPERAPIARADGELEPFFSHTAVAAGDVLVLGNSRFAALIAPEDIAAVVAGQEVEDALANLGELAADEDCTALVIEIEAVQDLSSSPSRLSRLPEVDRTMKTRASGEALRPGVLVAVATHLRRIRLLPLLGHGLAGAGKGLLAVFALVGKALRALFVQMLPDRYQEGLGRAGPIGPEGARSASPPTVAKSGRAAAPAQTAQAEETGRLSETAAGLPRSQKVLRVVALVIPLAVFLVAGMTYWRKGEALGDNFQALIEQTTALYQQSLSADAPTARSLLDRAGELLAQAEAIRRDDATLDELRSLIARRQDEVNGVQRLDPVVRLRSYDDSLTHLRRVVTDGSDVYVLDNGTDAVYHHRLDDAAGSLSPDEADPIIVRRAQQVGTNVVGELVDMTWVEATPKREAGALMILEAGGLLQYGASRQIESLPIGGTERWALPTAVMGYGGNFYILDPQAGQIFRYRPAEGGYVGPPELYLGQVQGVLTGAVDMAIDGYIYVLFADGNLRKFEGGLAAPFELSGLDRPFDNPTAIFTAPDQQVRYLYVADTGNRRIVQLEKDGGFVRQLKPRDEEAVNFEGIKSIFVDEPGGRLYLVDSQSLYMAAIPRTP